MATITGGIWTYKIVPYFGRVSDDQWKQTVQAIKKNYSIIDDKWLDPNKSNNLALCILIFGVCLILLYSLSNYLKFAKEKSYYILELGVELLILSTTICSCMAFSGIPNKDRYKSELMKAYLISLSPDDSWIKHSESTQNKCQNDEIIFPNVCMFNEYFPSSLLVGTMTLCIISTIAILVGGALSFFDPSRYSLLIDNDFCPKFLHLHGNSLGLEDDINSE